jgi:hypothetical protein
MNQDNITDITTYMRLCGAAHKRIYVLKSVMLSWPTKAPHLQGFSDAQRHIKTGFPCAVVCTATCFDFAAILEKKKESSYTEQGITRPTRPGRLER